MEENHYCPTIHTAKDAIDIALDFHTNLINALGAFDDTEELLGDNSLCLNQLKYKINLVAYRLGLRHIELFVIVLEKFYRS